MKIYRTIGTILSAFLTLIIVVALVASLLVLSAARAVSKDTISNITKTVLSNESFQQEISQSISSALTGMMQNLVSKPSQSPSQNPSQNENTGNTTQNPSQNENTGNTTQNPSQNENTGNTTQNPSQGDIISNVTEIAPLISEDAITEILNMPEVQDTLSDIVSNYAMAVLEQKEELDISCSQSIENMLAENPEAFNDQIGDIVADCNMNYDDFYSIASVLADKSNISLPPKGSSYTAVTIAVIGQKSEEIDALIESIIADLLPATDIAEDIPPQTSIVRVMPVLTAVPPMSSNADTEEAQSVLGTISEVLAILQNPRIYAAVFALLLFFFLITALFTWSFKRPLLFIGIATILSGALLIGVTAVPIPYDMLAEIAADMIMPNSAALESTMHDVLVTTWNSASRIIITHALISILVGILSCTGFALLCIFGKKKTPTAAAA